MEDNLIWLILLIVVALVCFFLGLCWAAYKWRHHFHLANPAFDKLLEMKDSERLLLVMSKDTSKKVWSVDALVVPEHAVKVLPTSNGLATVKFYEWEGFKPK